MDETVEKLAKAISLIRKSLTCSVCLEVCSDPYTPRCGHPFCQQCIGKVMLKRNSQCPMCNGRLKRRTVNRNDQLGNIIADFHKIEDAIKADIHIDIADYQTHPQSREAAMENMSDLFPKTYLPAPGSSKRNKVKPRIISDTKLNSSNSILNYINIKQQSPSSSVNSQTHKIPHRKTDNSDSSWIKKTEQAFVENIPKDSDTLDNNAQESHGVRQRGKVKSLQTASKTRKKQTKSTDDQQLIFKKVHQKVHEREERIINTSSTPEKRAEDLSLYDLETGKVKNVKASAEEAKKTWSRVRKFGKEMRPLQKKSLNVSIENKSHNTQNFSNQKIISAEVDSEDIFTSRLEKNLSHLNCSLSDLKEEENLVSHLSSKEVNEIIGVVPEGGSETDPFTSKNSETDSVIPQNIIDASSNQVQNLLSKECSSEEKMSKNLERCENQSFERSDSITEYFKGFKNVNQTTERIISGRTPPEDAISNSQEIVEDSNPEEKQEEKLFAIKQSLNLQKQNSDESHQISPEIPKIAANNEFNIQNMDFTLPVNSVQPEKKSSHVSEEMNRGVADDDIVSQNAVSQRERLKELEITLQPCEEVSEGLLNNYPGGATTELSNLSLKGIRSVNLQSPFTRKSSESCKLSLTEASNIKLPQVEPVVTKRSQLDKITKCSEVKSFIPFKKLGRIFKKQRRVPFYYLGSLCKVYHVDESSSITVLTPTQGEKHSKKNFSTTNLSDSGFSRTRANLSPETSKVNDSIQSSHPISSGTVVLLSPQNDSQLKHLSIGSPHKEGRLPILKTSFISGKDHLENFENTTLLRGSSCSNLEKQGSFITPKAKKNIAKNFEPLKEESEKMNEEEPSVGDKIVQNQDYKRLLDGSDFDIDTAQFKEFDDVANNAYKEDVEEIRKEEPKLFQDTDSGSIVPCSLDRSPKKQRLTSEHLIQPTFPQSSNSIVFENPPHLDYPGNCQRILQGVENPDLADRFFEDVIEKSKYIRANTSMDIVEKDIERSKEMQSNYHPIMQSEATELLDSKSKAEADEHVEKSSNSIKSIKSPNESKIKTELLDEYQLKQKEFEKHLGSEYGEETEFEPVSGFDSLQVNVQNEDLLHSDFDKENTIQNLNEVESSQPFTYSSKPIKTLSTSFVREKSNVSEGCSKICRTSAPESPHAVDKQSQDEEIINDSKTRGIVTPPNLSMNITEEQIMLHELEKELFGGKNTYKGEDVRLLPDGLKTPTASTARVGNTDLKSESNQTSEIPDDDVELIENTPKGSQKISQKVLYDKDYSNFSPIRIIDSNTSEVTKTFVQPSAKRKSCPLYHSTPKVPRTKTTSQRYATSMDGDVLLSSLQKPGKLTEEPFLEKSVSAEPKLTFVCSGLSSSQIETVKKLSKLVNADFTSTFNPNVTHVIVKVTGKQNAAEKTLKYLQGIAYGKWIVSVKWAYDSLQESKLLSEEKYETVDNLTSEEGPKKSRLRTRGIFEGFTCLCQGPFNDVSVEDYWDLLIHTGAKVVRTMEELAAEKQKLKIIVVEGDHWNDKIIVEWFKKTKAIPVEHEWIVECISQYKLISLLDYLQAIMPQDAFAIGFPEELLQEGSDSEYED